LKHLTFEKLFSPSLLSFRQALLAIFTIALLFLFRSLYFAAEHGSTEQDSGIVIGIAHSLATHGEFSSPINLLMTENTIGQAITGRWCVQDKSGRMFFTEMTIGPGYILPAALVLNIFGTSWWTLRIYPLIAFFFLLILLLLPLYYAGGIITVATYSLWLWCHPDFILYNSYESFSEPIGILYLLLSAYFLRCFGEKRFAFFQKHPILRIEWPLFLSGFFLSLAGETKTIFFINGLAFFLYWAYFLFNKNFSKRKTLYAGFIWCLGFLTPLVLFECYKLIDLTSRFNLDAYYIVNKSFWHQILYKKDSGIGEFAKQTGSFMLTKFSTLWRIYAIKNPSSLFWVFVGLGSILVTRQKNAFNAYFKIIVFSAWITLAWFVFLSGTGWARQGFAGHFLGSYLGILGIMLLAQRCWNFSQNGKIRSALTLSLVLIVGWMLDFHKLDPRPVFSKSDVVQWNINRLGPNDDSIKGFPSNAINPLDGQKEVAEFINKNIRESETIYFPGFAFASSLSAHVDRSFYSLERYFERKKHGWDFKGKKSYLILNESYAGPAHLRLFKTEDTQATISRFCTSIVFYNSANPLYLICELR
jgi:hypothetical protein